MHAAEVIIARGHRTSNSRWPSIAGYHAVVNIQRCNKKVLVVHERDQVHPLDAIMKFMIIIIYNNNIMKFVKLKLEPQEDSPSFNGGPT